MNSDPPFTTIGDEPVEARIVAWVLGEASAFEAAELERLCEERPELLVFRRRMRTLHGLLTEAEAAHPDEGWKLPPEKRKALDEIFGGEKAVSADPVIEKRIRFSARRALLTIAACLVLTVIIAGLVAPAGIQKARKSAQVREPEMKVDFLPGGSAGGAGIGGAGGVAASEDEMALLTESRRKAQPLSASSPEQPRSSRARVAAESAVPDLPELEKLASDDSLKDIRGVSTFESKTASGGDTSKDGSGKGFGFAAPATAAPSAAPVDAVVPLGKAKVSKEMAAADTPDLPDMDLAKLEVSGGAGYPGEVRPKVFAGMLVPESETAQDAGNSGVASGGFGGGGGGQADADAGVLMTGATAGIRSGDLAVNRNSIDAVLNNPNRPEGNVELLAGKKMKVADAEMPVLGERFAQTGEKREVTMDGGASAADSNGWFGRAEPQTAVTGGVLAINGGTLDEKGKGAKPGAELNDRARQESDSERGRLLEEGSDGSVALAMQNRKVGKYDEARKLLKGVVDADPANEDAQRELANLDDPVRTHPAQTAEHGKNVDEVRRKLYMAEGNYNLGKYDDAKREYEDALRTDPYNSAARRGLERIASAKSDYYRAAYDHTRSELLAQVDSSWELAVPADGTTADSDRMKQEDAASHDLAFRFDTKRNTPGSEQNLTKSLNPVEGVKLQPMNMEVAGRISADPAADESVVDSYWDTSKATETGKRSGGVEYEIHTGYKSEYLFRGLDLSDESKEKPPVPLVDLMEEITAAEDPYSTFSLNISDASFQVAQAALAKGERPDPAGIKVEQFYNAVDYGDPAPAADEPVAVNIEQSAHPVIPGRNLVRVALKTAAAGRSATQPLRLTLLVDQSGSMVREDRRAAMDKALAGLSELLTDKDLVTVIGFSRTPRLLADGLTGDKAGNIAGLVNQAANEGGTNLEEAIKLGEQMADRHKLAGAQNRIVLFTDGAANLGNADPARLAEKVKQLRQKGIAFDIAGIAAEDLNDELLGELARNGNGRYYVVGKGADDNLAKQLAGAFRPAAENVKVQVRFNPERVGRYKLIGFEKDRLKTEDFRNDAVDAAELAAEEAGVAIYQIEALPGGSGELGEVGVRFRDAASGRMVERSWTIPHDAGAPAFDRAAPSMQLAALSMLAAEKLKGGPLADAIDFKQLAGAAANVKQFYGNTGRPGEVLRMVDALK